VPFIRMSQLTVVVKTTVALKWSVMYANSLFNFHAHSICYSAISHAVIAMAISVRSSVRLASVHRPSVTLAILSRRKQI